MALIDETRLVAPAAGAVGPLTSLLVREVLHHTHAYAPGLDHRRPTLTASTGRRAAAEAGRDCSRDLLERAATRAGFSHRHFDPDRAADTLVRILELAPGLEATYARLSDERSRRALVEVLRLRVLGPYHATLRLTPEAYRAHQREADRTLCLRAGTFAVSDPWFSPLSLYRVAPHGVTLHSHSVDIVSVFLLGQYSYPGAVKAGRGDVVLDIGGCWGDTALYFADLVGPTGKVFTFEFDPETLDVMRANLALNPELASRIEIVERALWHRSDEVLTVHQAGRMTSVTDSSSPSTTVSVETITVDDFVARAGLTRLDFVKMDVEGAEPDVLAGAQASLERFAPALAIAAYHRDDDLVRLPAALPERYRLYLESFSPIEDETVLFAAP